MKRTLSFVAALLASFAFDAAAAVPQSCADVKAANPAAADGDYLIVPNLQPFTVYCHDMAGDPREYLTLVNTGGSSNYSKWGREVLGFPTGNVFTHYTRIRIDPATLLVNIGDQTFSSSSGFDCCIGRTPIVSMPYAHASSCAGGIDDGDANVDLTGLPFEVADTFTLRGFGPIGSANGTMLFNDGDSIAVQGQVVKLSGGGFCGGIGPTENGGSFNAFAGFDLQLQFIGPDGKQTCKKGGWTAYGVFKNQGDCVSYFATGGTNQSAN